MCLQMSSTIIHLKGKGFTCIQCNSSMIRHWADCRSLNNTPICDTLTVWPVFHTIWRIKTYCKVLLVLPYTFPALHEYQEHIWPWEVQLSRLAHPWAGSPSTGPHHDMSCWSHLTSLTHWQIVWCSLARGMIGQSLSAHALHSGHGTGSLLCGADDAQDSRGWVSACRPGSTNTHIINLD